MKLVINVQPQICANVLVMDIEFHLCIKQHILRINMSISI